MNFPHFLVQRASTPFLFMEKWLHFNSWVRLPVVGVALFRLPAEAISLA